MAKYHGEIGFAVTEDDGTGIWEQRLVTREYAGEIYSIRNRYAQGNERNGEVTQSLQLSIIADPFFYEKIGFLAYVEYRGLKWVATTNDLTSYPRITIDLGGVYNGGQD